MTHKPAFVPFLPITSRSPQTTHLSPLSPLRAPIPSVAPSRHTPRLSAPPPEETMVESKEPESKTLLAPLTNLLSGMRNKRDQLKAGVLANYGLAAVLAYGMFDALTYAVCFFISLRGFLIAGKELSWHTLPQVLAVMWGLNNLSRPFRIAGAVALAPVVDRVVVRPCRNFISQLRNPDSDS